LALLPGATASTTDYRSGMAALQRLPALLDYDKYVAATAKQAAERLRKRRAERTAEGEQP
jgi:hypothetical protein